MLKEYYKLENKQIEMINEFLKEAIGKGDINKVKCHTIINYKDHIIKVNNEDAGIITIADNTGEYLIIEDYELGALNPNILDDDVFDKLEKLINQ